jgi:hypothetical protein
MVGHSTVQRHVGIGRDAGDLDDPDPNPVRSRH